MWHYDIVFPFLIVIFGSVSVTLTSCHYCGILLFLRRLICSRTNLFTDLWKHVKRCLALAPSICMTFWNTRSGQRTFGSRRVKTLASFSGIWNCIILDGQRIKKIVGIRETYFIVSTTSFGRKYFSCNRTYYSTIVARSFNRYTSRRTCILNPRWASHWWLNARLCWESFNKFVQVVLQLEVLTQDTLHAVNPIWSLLYYMFPELVAAWWLTLMVNPSSLKGTHL